MEITKNGTLFNVVIPKELNGFTIERILREYWPTPKKLLHQIRMEKSVMINGDYKSWTAPLSAGDKFSIAIFKDEDPGVTAWKRPIDVLFEDDHLLVVNKPEGMDTHPNNDEQTDTLANAVAYYYEKNNISCRVRHVHRLDRDTTGAVLFAKTAWSHAILDHMLTERKVKRTYWALVHGFLNPDSGLINKAIGRDRHHPTRRRVSPSGQHAITHYHVLDTIKKEKLSLVACTLDTGRTHQIRVHMSFLGHPLAGDTLYGGKPIYQRQALHARKLQFVHPFTKVNIECTAPFLDEPPIFEAFLK
ncbi:RluA family pseudouridine synthase [Heyndrickxia acidicola]|uniref:Pseudouridine synthase n=1 Tax=Heyndrickxia acidicola TaxID=209389 RepID=A0ABU6MCW2_9BACI|nr:RluA family pseudouridine synthase [Heyndrickxia acidicola]MED1202355.1 RluA family pseudouridine synthase [Heyndrickxia acidicola]